LKCIFICAEENPFTREMRNQGYETVILNSPWDKLDNEKEELRNVIESSGIKLLFLDTYFVTYDYLSYLRQSTRIAYIDDLNMFKYPCDILINYSKYYSKFKYHETYENTELLLGPEYTPLRDEFQKTEARRPINDVIKSILLITGGTDNYNFAYEFLKYILENNLLKKININIVCGTFNRKTASLLDLAQKRDNISVFSDAVNMSELMKAADMAVSAAGISLYELASCGTPTACFTLADNQMDNALSFAEDNVMRYAGDIRKDMPGVFKNILQYVDELLSNRERRLKISQKLLRITDGKGSERIAKALVEFINS